MTNLNLPALREAVARVERLRTEGVVPTEGDMRHDLQTFAAALPALLDELEAARAVLDTVEPYGVWPDLNSPHGFLRVDSAKLKAWQGRKR